jgi:hypothetical protein
MRERERERVPCVQHTDNDAHRVHEVERHGNYCCGPSVVDLLASCLRGAFE